MIFFNAIFSEDLFKNNHYAYIDIIKHRLAFSHLKFIPIPSLK